TSRQYSSESAVRGAAPLAQLVEKPGSGEGPVAVGGPGGDAQDAGGLFQLQPREEAELDQLGTKGVLPRQFLQGLIDGREVVRGLFDGEVDLVQAEPAPIAAPLQAALVAGAVQQDASHGFRDGGKEMPAAVPALNLLRADQPDVSLVDQGRGVERLPRLFL